MGKAMTSFPGNRPGPAGYTLIELLTVMAIIAMIGGLSAGAYQAAKRNYALAASAGKIQGILRAARNTSLSTGSESFVVVDPVLRKVTAHAFERVGEWSFEESDEATGLSIDRSTVHDAAVVSGRIGKGLDFRAPGSYVDCGSEARFDLRTGVLVEAWVRHFAASAVKAPAKERKSERVILTAPRARKTSGKLEPALPVLRKAVAYSLAMTRSGALEGSIGEWSVRTDDGVVAPERWVRITLRFEGGSIELTADGVPREAFPTEEQKLSAGAKKVERDTIPLSSAPVTISYLEQSFPGQIDEVKLSGTTEPLLYMWGGFEQVLGWKKVIHFDRFGHLDPRYHTEGVRMVLAELPDVDVPQPTTVVVVDYSVTFDEWLSRWDTNSPQLAPKGTNRSPLISTTERPSLRQSVEEANLEAKLGSARRIPIEVDLLGVVK